MLCGVSMNLSRADVILVLLRGICSVSGMAFCWRALGDCSVVMDWMGKVVFGC